MNEFLALIVDDDLIVQMLLKRTLAPIAGRIFVAETLATALKIVQEQPNLHIITLDLSMPSSTIEDVVDSIAYMRKKHPQCTIIVMSGHVSTQRELIKENSADAMIDKCSLEGRETFLRPLIRSMYAHFASDPKRVAQLNELMDKLFPERENGLPCNLSGSCPAFQQN